MKKLVVLLVVLVMALSAFAGCGDSAKESEPSADTMQKTEEKAEATAEPEAGPEWPMLVSEPTTIEYWCEIDEAKIGVHTRDYNDLLQFKEFERLTGIHIEFFNPPSGQTEENFNLLMVTNDRPDIFFRNWVGVAGGPQKMIEDGVFLDLKDYFLEDAPYLMEFLTDPDPDNQKMYKDIMTDEGSFYCFPYVRPKQNLKNFEGYMARGDWVTNLNITPPQTIAEWEAAMQIVLENDANGNGDPNDEIPLTARTITDDPTIYGFAGAWGIKPYVYVKPDGSAGYGAIEDVYKDYLKVMKSWLDKGYIDPDFASLDVQQKQARITESEIGRVGFFWDGLGMGMSTYVTNLGGDSKKVIPLNYPTLDKHTDTPMYFYGNPAEFSGAGSAISATAEDPHLCAQWLDFWWSPQGYEIVNFGVEGVTFNWVDEGGDELYPRFVDDITNNPDMSVSVAISQYNLGGSWGPFAHDYRVRDQRMLKLPEQQEAGAMWKKADLSGMMPFVSFTAEESTEAADIESEIKTYVDEMSLKFIMGQVDIDAEFESFVNTIKSMGVERLLELNDGALARYFSRETP